MSEIIARLPEGTDARMNVYLTSPLTGIEVVVGVTWRGAIPSLDDLPKNGLELAKSLGSSVGILEEMANDWRLMTRAEVDDYQHRQEHGDPEDDDLEL